MNSELGSLSSNCHCEPLTPKVSRTKQSLRLLRRPAFGVTPGNDERLILALDVDNFDKAKYFVNLLYPRIRIFKVGFQLFTAAGHKVLEFIRKKGADIFLDLKFLDIPNTVSNAVRQAVRLRVKMLTLHILGGEDMLKASVRAAREGAVRLKIKRPYLIGVTVLTSQKADPNEVLRLARLGLESGLDGVVCSAQEVSFLKKRLKKKFIAVTPGIRLAKAEADDQKRTSTVQEAIKAGSDFLVIGRPILEARDPVMAVKEMLWQKK